MLQTLLTTSCTLCLYCGSLMWRRKVRAADWGMDTHACRMCIVYVVSMCRHIQKFCIQMSNVPNSCGRTI